MEEQKSYDFFYDLYLILHIKVFQTKTFKHGIFKFAAMVRVLCDIKETHLSCLQARLQGERCVEEDAGVLIKETW
ncbi:unnamed protein product [Lathyrus oleraceus]